LDRPSCFANISSEECIGIIGTDDIPPTNTFEDPNVAQHCKKIECPFNDFNLEQFVLDVKPIDLTEHFDTHIDRYTTARNYMRTLLQEQGDG
jgi:hypothetical protein